MYVSVVSVYVADLERAVAFYRDVLGWDVTGDFPMGESRWVTVAPKHEKTAFSLVHGFGDWSPDKVGIFTGIVLDVDDVMQSYEELRERGVEFDETPRREPWGGWASFADSEGNRFGLHDNHVADQPRDRSVVGKLLGMSSAPRRFGVKVQ